MQLPTITINHDQKIIVRRLLPGLGEVLVQRGQQVRALDVVARAESPSQYRAVNIAQQLAKNDLKMAKAMHKKIGDLVEAGEVLATRKNPFRRWYAYAPEKGYLVAIGQGWALLETERTVTQVQAFIDGTVSRVVANRGVLIETMGTIIQAACGFGGEAYGLLKRLVDGPTDYLDPDDIDAHTQNTILLAGQAVDEEVLRQAEAHQVRGIIVGSIDAALLNLEPPVNLCVVATEGFGDIPMSNYTFGILRSLANREISIRGITSSITSQLSLMANYTPPIILAPSGKKQSETALAPTDQEATGQDLMVGSRVRVTRGQFLGAITTIESFPDQPQATESGIVTPGAFLMLDRVLHYIPLANLQQVQ